LPSSNGISVFFSGEALYASRDMGTVEAALANGKETAQAFTHLERQLARKDYLLASCHGRLGARIRGWQYCP
jgi:hypothetical protein